ncbi:hypothetical protein JVU11DRAFT_4910 [Chiua virens]|nr:hypothetical protein JVU11DRAFT_4910 [Chiua virens]
MTQEIKFTSFGIPYIREFENVSVIPHRRRKESPAKHAPSSGHPSTFYNPNASPSCSSSTSSFCYIDSPPGRPPRFPSFSFRSPTSLFKRKPTDDDYSPTYHTISSRDRPTDPPKSGIPEQLPSPPESNSPETHGIYIQFPSDHVHPRQMSRKEKLVLLQQTISMAVLDAGMSRSPGNSTRPESHSDDIPVHSSRGYRTTDALFCGTYGQLMAALEGAGLSAAPCEEGLSRCRYLFAVTTYSPCAQIASTPDTRLGALFVARNVGATGVQLRKITLWG